MASILSLRKQFRASLKGRATPTKLFQAWIDQDLLARVTAKRHRENLSWRDLVESCFKLYLEMSKQYIENTIK